MIPSPAGKLSYDGVVVVIPALNEEASIGLVVSALPPVGAILVVDNGSTDGTAEQARAAGATVLMERRRGYGNACQAGIREAFALKADVVVILDADNADDPSLIGQLVDPILLGELDFVLSDRTRSADTGALLPHQRYGNRLATRLMKVSTGHRYADMGPFRAIRAHALQALDMQDPNYGWNVEMQMKAVQHGLRIREVSMPYRQRIGQSKISGTVQGTVKAGAKIIWSVGQFHKWNAR